MPFRPVTLRRHCSKTQIRDRPMAQQQYPGLKMRPTQRPGRAQTPAEEGPAMVVAPLSQRSLITQWAITPRGVPHGERPLSEATGHNARS